MQRNIEEPVAFENEGMQLVGMLHYQEKRTKSPAVIFYHGCTGTKTEAHWLYVKLARSLARLGIMVFRFDFRNSGDSEGDFERMTVSGEISDGLHAVEFLIKERNADPGRIGLAGLSLGGVVAAEVAGRLQNRIRSCVLLNPIARPADDIGAIAAMNKLETGSFPVEFNSFLFGYDFAQDLSIHKPLDTIKNATCPVLIINSSNDKVINPVRSKEYVEVIEDSGGIVEFYGISGADHTFTGTKWERQVAKKLSEWFTKTLL